MTEKQFKVINISKNGMKGLFQLGNDNLSIYDVARLLNELLEENEQLKKILGFLPNDNTTNILNVLNSQENKIWELKQENEQLKQQIQQLQHWNKCLAEKRHQELSYRHYTASKSEKELKELLEPKLFNCSDRIKSDRYD